MLFQPLEILRRLMRLRMLRRLGVVAIEDASLFRAAIVPGPLVALESCELRVGPRSLVRGSIHFDRSGARLSVGANTAIGVGTQLVVSDDIQIGQNVLISYGCLVMDHDGHSLDIRYRQRDLDDMLLGRPKDWAHVARQRVCVGDGAWIGAGAVLLKGVSVGAQAVVGARAVVAKSVPAGAVVAGNPAKVIGDVSELLARGGGHE